MVQFTAVEAPWAEQWLNGPVSNRGSTTPAPGPGPWPSWSLVPIGRMVEPSGRDQGFS